MKNKSYISIVSPVYKAEKIVDELVKRIAEETSKITDNFEIILIEDGSPDNSWEAIERNCKKDSRVKGIKLSRNFGQHYAITAGLDNARGNWIVVMDCDLQDRPDEISNLFNKAQEGWDIVLASRHQRQDSLFKKLFSRLFYFILSYLTGIKHDSSVANFGIYNGKVIKAITSMPENIRYFPTMVKWVGFKQTQIKVVHSERQDGKSTYNYKKLFNLALDITLAYSDRPIRIVVKLGFFITSLSFLLGIIVLLRYYFDVITVSGYTSLILSICFFSGLIISILGVIGLYVGKIFQGVKNRPIYLIDKINNL